MGRAKEWWGARRLWQKVLIVILGLGFLAAPFADDEARDAQEPTTTLALAANDTTSAAPPSTEPANAAPTTTSGAPTTTITTPLPATTTLSPTPPSTTTPPIPDYTIAATEDISYADVVRIRLRVTVPVGTTRPQLSLIANDLVDQHRASHRYHAFTVAFYHYPEVSLDVASLGVWEDVPFGDWGRAGEVDRGDYSKHEPNDRTKEKDWSLLPTPAEVDLYAAFNDTFEVLNAQSDDYPSDEAVFAAVASDSGASPSDVEDAVNAVFDWIFNSI